MEAVVIGATGLVGKQIVHLLLDDPAWSRVRVLGRRACGVTHAKLDEHVIDFDRPEAWRELVRGDVAFSALGTTLKAAGSKEAQWRVDYTYQHEFAKAASANGVPAFVLISSGGASASSRMFYLRMKGELERDVSALPFERVRLLQPSVLDGEREEKRTAERFFVAVLRPISSILSAKVRPVRGETVARAAIRSALDTTSGPRLIEAQEIFNRGEAAAEGV